MQSTTPQEILQRYWHYEHFRPLQEEIINSVLSGHDTLALLPTGGGKSLCYQLPALAMEGLTLVVSPLIALMKDQVSQLRGRHIAAACIISGMTRQEVEGVLNNCIYGKTKLLYVSPERLKSQTFLAHLRQMRVSMIAVDEAHCISQWGYDFRPPYLEIARIRDYHPAAPVIALTATATPEVVDDIERNLTPNHLQGTQGVGRFRRFQSSFFRSNLSYSVLHEEDKQTALLRIARNVGGSGIVYVRNRRRTVETARMLNDNGIAAAAYHAGIAQKERDKRQQDWIASRGGVMVATNAFGMGIDKPDVRFVVHLDIPESPEAYFQEAGRAGRDGKRAYAVLVCNEGDVAQLRESIDREFPTVQYIKNAYRAVCNYYQVPVGAGTDSSFDFKLDDICRTYAFEYVPFFSALKFLEREGLIELPEHNDLQSRLHIPISKEALYRFQVDNRRAGDMLTAILRLYGGVFSDHIPISEQLVGQRCGMSETQTVNLLTELNRLQIVDYRRRRTHPQIVFTSPRIDINDLYVSDRNYKELKAAAVKRREAMVAYAVDDRECRSRQLLRYFGEEQADDCGCCDVCIARRKGPRPVTAETITSLLEQEPMNIRQLYERLGAADRDALAATVRELLDKGELRMDVDMTLRTA